LVIRQDVIQGDQLYGERVLPYLMGQIDSLDIDSIVDLQMAEYWLQGGF